MTYWFKPRCWICLGTGWLGGPFYKERCPNDHCPHRKDTDG